MSRITYISTHALAAGAFFFLFQRYGLNASLQEASMWGVGSACAAAILAYVQTQRGR